MRLKAKIASMAIHRGTSRTTHTDWQYKDVVLQLIDNDCRLTNTFVSFQMKGDSILFNAPAVCEGATGIAGVWIDRYNNRIVANISGWEPQKFIEGEKRNSELTEIDKAWLNVAITKTAYYSALAVVDSIKKKEEQEQLDKLNAAAITTQQTATPVQAAPTAAPVHASDGLPF